MATVKCPRCGGDALPGMVGEVCCRGPAKCGTVQITSAPAEPAPASFAAYTAGLRGPMDRVDVSSISDAELLRRFVTACHSRRRPRWAIVMQYAQLGSTYAKQLCARFGLNPDETVK